MERSEGYIVITKLVNSGILNIDHNKRLTALRTLICNGKENECDMAIVRFLWMLSHEDWLNEAVKSKVEELVRSLYMHNFEKCGTGISAQCKDCPYNEHFSWGD